MDLCCWLLLYSIQDNPLFASSLPPPTSRFPSHPLCAENTTIYFRMFAQNKLWVLAFNSLSFTHWRAHLHCDQIVEINTRREEEKNSQLFLYHCQFFACLDAAAAAKSDLVPFCPHSGDYLKSKRTRHSMHGHFPICPHILRWAKIINCAYWAR